MAGTFFVSWALWEKLVFVRYLARVCFTKVLTMIVGAFKLAFTHWRVRKYSTLGAIAGKVNIMRERSIIRSLSTKRRKSLKTAHPVIPRSGHPETTIEVPFGIRALEAGDHYDDVWDSTPNSTSVSQSNLADPANYTPLATPATPTSYSLARRHPSDLTLTSDHVSAQPYLALNSSPMGSSYDLSVRSPPPKQYPPHSFLRYEGSRKYRTRNSFLPTRSKSAANLSDGMDPVQSSPTLSTSGSYSSQRLHKSPIPAQLNLSTLATPPVKQESQSDRSGRVEAEGSGSSQRSSDTHSILVSPQHGEASDQIEIRWDVRDPTMDSDNECNTHMEYPDDDDRLSFIYNEYGQDADVKHFSTPTIRIIAETPNLNGASARLPIPLASDPSLASAVSYPWTPPATPTSTVSVSSRRSREVLRRVNSGFAVLKPGTLEAQSATPLKAKTYRARSASAESRGSMASHRERRRLQKRRHPGTRSNAELTTSAVGGP